MKLYIIFCITVFFVINSNYLELNAVTCDIDTCIQAPWYYDTLTVPNNCTGCEIRVAFMHRLNSCTLPNYPEIIITKLWLTGECIECYNRADIFILAFDYVLRNNPSIQSVLINNGPCIANYIARIVKCWYWSGNPQPCFGVSNCCWFKFMTCKRNGIIIIDELIDSWGDPENCEDPPFQCYSACEWVNDHYNPVPITSRIASDNSNKSIDYLQIIPNPSNGMLNINYHSNLLGSIYLELYDMLGNLVSSSVLYKNDEKLDEKLNFPELNNGIYIIHLKYKNTVVASERFTIIK